VLNPCDNPQAFFSLWKKAGANARKKAIRENKELGIKTSGTYNGEIGRLNINRKFVPAKFEPK